MARTSCSIVQSDLVGRPRDPVMLIPGSGVPSLSIGRLGEFYIDQTGKRMYRRDAGGWTDLGVIKGDRGWLPVLAAKNDGARRVHQVVDWAGGEGTKPATGAYVGATGLVSAIGDAVDVRGPQGPEMLISSLTAASGAASYDTLVAVAEEGGENRVRTVQGVVGAGGHLPFKTVSDAAAADLLPSIKYVTIVTAADEDGGPGHIRVRVDAEPADGPKHRSADRYLSTGVIDSANGGWWGLEFAPSLQSTDVQVPSVSGKTVSRPYVNRLRDNIILTDYIDKAQWAAIRSGSPIGYITNDRGQDSFDGIASDILTSGGVLRVPEGTFRVPHKTVSKDRLSIVAEKGAIWQTNQATGDQIVMDGLFQSVIDLRFGSTVARTAGACVRCTHLGSRAHSENLESDGAYTLIQVDGHPSNPSLDGGIYTHWYPRAYNGAAGGVSYLVTGGFSVHIHNPYSIGNFTLAPSTWPQNALRVTRAQDLKVDGCPQFLGMVTPVLVAPATGGVVASFKMTDGYCGLSQNGSLITAELGGTIVSTELGPVWFGETAATSAAGLTLKGHHADGIQTIKLMGTEFPLCAGNGFYADQYVKGLQITGGWADGCTQAGFAFDGTKGFSALIRSGGDRFGGNGVGAYLSGACDDFILIALLKGNLTNLSNGAGTSSSKIVTAIT